MGFRVLLFAFILALNTTQAHVRPPPKGLHYIGVGYNLLEGNPEGGQLSNGGVDPGLLFTRKVFKFTWDTNKVTIDKTTSLPDQVSYAPRQSCVKTNQKEVVTGSKSYQEKLSVDVSASGKYWNLTKRSLWCSCDFVQWTTYKCFSIVVYLCYLGGYNSGLFGVAFSLSTSKYFTSV